MFCYRCDKCLKVYEIDSSCSANEPIRLSISSDSNEQQYCSIKCLFKAVSVFAAAEKDFSFNS